MFLRNIFYIYIINFQLKTIIKYFLTQFTDMYERFSGEFS